MDIVFDVYIRNSLKADQGRRGVQELDGKSLKQVKRQKYGAVFSVRMTTNPNYLRFWRKKIAYIETDKTVIKTKGEGIVVTTNIDTSQLCHVIMRRQSRKLLNASNVYQVQKTGVGKKKKKKKTATGNLNGPLQQLSQPLAKNY